MQQLTAVCFQPICMHRIAKATFFHCFICFLVFFSENLGLHSRNGDITTQKATSTPGNKTPTPKQIKTRYNTTLARKVAVEKDKLEHLPPPRSHGTTTVEVNFTERAFPSAKREVNTEMEEQWAKKQHEALKKAAGLKSSDGIEVKKCRY